MTVVVAVDGSRPSAAAIQLALRTVQGVAGRKLVETADRAGAELVVLATRRGGSMLPGTVSQYVLHNAPCPVLVVPGARRGR